MSHFAGYHEIKRLEIDHKYYMGLALKEAQKAFGEGEVPVGAVMVHEGKVVSSAHNSTEGDCDPTSHAEISAIKGASDKLDRWRLSGATLYVTLEPCTMCAGAIVLSRIDKLVFGCFDPKAGAVGSLYNITAEQRLNHKVSVISGIRETECSNLLKNFFKGIRSAKRG